MMQINRSDREIGKVTRVKTYNAQVELSKEALSYTKSSDGDLYKIGVINSYVILPVGSERVVGIVTSLDMLEEAESSYEKLKMLILPTSRRTMWISMIGTITQNPITKSKKFEYGIRQYPELNNPVWHATKDDLDIIFEKEVKDENRKNKLISIGKSPLFPDYDVKLNMDEFFGKHAAILGNTGSGKSCTVTAIIDSVMNHPNGNNMPNAHFVIFDTNSEYKKAFTKYDGDGKIEEKRYNRFVISNEGDKPTGFWMPHWFMNGRDYDAFFSPGEGAQGPVLHKAIISARSEDEGSDEFYVFENIDVSLRFIQGIASNEKAYNGIQEIQKQVDGLLSLVKDKNSFFEENDIQEECSNIIERLTEIKESIDGKSGYVTSDIRQVCQEKTKNIRAILGDIVTGTNGKDQIGIDTPKYFNFQKFVNYDFQKQVELEAKENSQIRTYVGTLLTRLNRALNDPRYEFLFKVENFDQSLATFLSYILGISPHKYQADTSIPWKSYYDEQSNEIPDQHNLTILDFSQLASDVLENITALIGRILLEFIQKVEPRGKYPIVIVLEEAHRYIPSNAKFDRQIRAREVFERIAKEGRKYGLGLLVASQRPSELSRTVLAQCNSFIVHRIQNPDDKEYFKSVVSSIDQDLLNQLPTLPQQQALVMGDCITVPLQVKINDVDPKPDSDDPEFFKVWSDPDANIPNLREICSSWEMSDDYDTDEGGN